MKQKGVKIKKSRNDLSRFSKTERVNKKEREMKRKARKRYIVEQRWEGEIQRRYRRSEKAEINSTLEMGKTEKR